MVKRRGAIRLFIFVLSLPQIEKSLRFASGAFSFHVLLFAQINVSNGISAGVVG